VNKPKKSKIGQMFADGTEIERALQKGAQEAVELHRKLGFPIVEWRDGKVVWVPPEELAPMDESAK
jgi:hypothetical protein